MSDQVKKLKTAAKSARIDRKQTSWLRVLLWALFFIFLGLAVLAVILWVNRYSLIERQAQKEFSKAGIEAAFEIDNITGTSAVFNNLQLSDEEGPFLTAEQLSVAYTFEKIRAGIVDKITLKSPVLRLTLDASGNVIDGWIPEGSADSDPVSMPKDGIHIENGLVNWAAPWGAGATGITAHIQSETKWQSVIDMQTARFAQDDVEFDYSFSGEIDRLSADDMEITGKLGLTSARFREALTGLVQSDLDLKLSSVADSDTVDISGKFDVAVTGGVFPSFSTGYTDLDVELDAKFNTEKEDFDHVRADWKFEGDGLSLTDPQLRERLVRRSMSYNALTKTPIAMYFANEFERNGKRFFEQFSANGTGTYIHDGTGYEVEFAQPFVLESPGQEIVLTPAARPEIKFKSKQKQIDLDMHVDWDSTRELNFRNLRLKGRSENGLLLTGVDEVTAIINSKQTWRRNIGGEKFRLAPMHIDFGLKNSSRGGQIRLTGDINYDGKLPGGRADNLQAGGEILVNTADDTFAMSFQPNQTIKMAEFISSTGWRAEEIAFDLIEGEDVLTRNRGEQPFRSSLRNVNAAISSPTDDRHLQAYFEALQVTSEFQSDPRIWDLGFQGIDLTSDDFPSPGTRVQSDAGKAKVIQSPDGSVEFVITSPNTAIATDNVQVTDLFIEMSGIPEDFSAEYRAGGVLLKNGEVPEVPMEGTARLQNGVLSGQAVAPMPRTRDTPINIEYKSEEGVGSAHISIPKVVFTPRGLQPQYLIPALRGKLAEVRGEASADFNFTFGDGGPVRSRGTTTLTNMDIGTLVGPASGVTAELTFKSMFPLETDGVQTATLAGFDAGIPLENGTIKFEMVPDGVRIDEAIWPVKSDEHGDGKIYISPMLWQFGNVENQAVVNVENLSLGEILAGIGNESLSATGQITGRLPAMINGVNVEIHDGILSIKDGGVIRYRNQGIDTFAKDAKSPAFLGDAFAGSETGFAFKALENFEYKELEAFINGPLDGEMTLRMLFGGKNPDVLAGTAFEFDVAVSGELGNIARDSIGSLDPQKHLDAIIDMQHEDSQKLQE